LPHLSCTPVLLQLTSWSGRPLCRLLSINSCTH
jgi:hypothetical protein